MRYTALCLLAIALLLSSCGSSQQLTRSKAMEILDKIAAQAKVARITLTSDQMQKVRSLGPKASDSLSVEAAKQCLPDRSDVRVTMGGVALCPGPVPPEVTWQQPGVFMPLKKPVAWTLLEVTGITDAANSQHEKIVEYTWQYDFSPFPKEVQDALKYPPRPGKSLLRLYDDGWRFVEYK